MHGLVTVFGGTGFVGRQVVRALAKRGARVRVAVRQPGRGYRLRMLGDVGQIEIVQANIRDPASTARALDGATAAVNLVAVLFESGRQSFRALHVDGAASLAAAAKLAGVSRFVQVSAIGANPKSPSRYGRTKAAGEAAVRAVYPDAVIIRPSIIFGSDDAFFNRFAQMATISPFLPLIGGGKTLFQPVYVADVAAGIAQAVKDPDCAGQIYELGGPGTYSFRELLALMLAETGQKRLLLPIPFSVADLIGRFGDLQALLMPPILTSDQVASLRSNNVANPAMPGLAALGIAPTALEPIIPTYLYRFRDGGQYAATPAGAGL